MRLLIISILLTHYAAQPVWAGKLIPLLSDVYRIQEVDEPNVSPDGEWVAYSVYQLHGRSDDTSTNLWLLSLKNKKSKQITSSTDSNNYLPKWSPDGQWIAYLSDVDDSTQIRLYSVKKDTHTALTNLDMEISDFSWSPDSQEIALIGQVSKDEDDSAPIVINRYSFKTTVMDT